MDVRLLPKGRPLSLFLLVGLQRVQQHFPQLWVTLRYCWSWVALEEHLHESHPARSMHPHVMPQSPDNDSKAQS